MKTAKDFVTWYAEFFATCTDEDIANHLNELDEGERDRLSVILDGLQEIG